MASEGLLIIVSGPSATGKGTVCKALLEKESQIYYSVSATTRSPRPGEEDGVNYFFLNRARFEEMIAADEFLEWAEVYGNYYGTPVEKVFAEIAQGRDVILEIDTQGAMKVKAKYPQAIYVFIMPPSMAELEARIRKRGTETEEVIARRLSCAIDEMSAMNEYNYVIVNDLVEEAAGKISAILKAEKCRIERNTHLIPEQSYNKKGDDC